MWRVLAFIIRVTLRTRLPNSEIRRETRVIVASSRCGSVAPEYFNCCSHPRIIYASPCMRCIAYLLNVKSIVEPYHFFFSLSKSTVSSPRLPRHGLPEHATHPRPPTHFATRHEECQRSPPGSLVPPGKPRIIHCLAHFRPQPNHAGKIPASRD